MVVIILGILYLLWQVIKWVSKWIIVLPIIMFLLFEAVLIGTMFPIIGAILHGLAAVYSSIHIILAGQVSIWQVLILAALLLAIIDCVSDIVFTLRYGKEEMFKTARRIFSGLTYAWHSKRDLDVEFSKLRNELKEDLLDNSYRMIRALVSGATVALGAAWLYFIASDVNPVANIFVNIDVLLILLVIPRAGFVISDKIADAVIYPQVLNLLKKDEFFPHKESLYYGRFIFILRHQGLVVTNAKTISEEKKTSKWKLYDMYPKTALEKIAEKFVDDKAFVNKRNNAEAELEKNRKACCISPTGYAKFCIEMEQTLMGSGTFSPRTFIEKKFPTESERLLSLGVDYFLIQAFEEARKERRVIDSKLSDEPLVNHAYRHVQSTVKPKVINADEDPRLALDE